MVDDARRDDAALVGTTDELGAYEIDVPDGSWQVWATHTPTWLGRTFALPLHPLDDTPFDAEVGAVRDFEWRLEGPLPAPLVGTYGGSVHVLTDGAAVLPEDLELTLEPIGELIDGSVGALLVRSPDATGRIEDVPLGQYRISAVDRRRASPMVLRLEADERPFQDEVVAVFEPVWEDDRCTDCLRLELSAP